MNLSLIHFFLVLLLRLVTSEKLSVAKRLLDDEYRNALIDIFVAAPTIIVPTSSNLQLLQLCPVLVVHLGSLTVSLQYFYLT